MRKLSIAMAGATALLAFNGAVKAAGDVEAGKAKAMVCAACHGADGIGTLETNPNLAGQKAGYLVKQMKAFKAGERNDPTMSAMMAPLTDGDIENLAAYFSSLGK